MTGRYSNQLNYRSGWGGESYLIGDSAIKLILALAGYPVRGLGAVPFLRLFRSLDDLSQKADGDPQHRQAHQGIQHLPRARGAEHRA